jgi:phenylacetate-CoA ligase
MITGKYLYDHAPVWGQTWAVNFASAFSFPRKYGASFHRFLGQLEANEKKSLDQLLAEQQTAVRQLLRYAVAHVPAYKGRSPDNLNEWPVLTKATVAAAPEKFLSDEFSTPRLAALQTSGTTGTPLTVWFTNECHQREMAFRWRHKAWGGAPFLSRSAYLSGHPVVPAWQAAPPFWRADHVEKRLLCSSYHFAPEHLPEYAAALTRFAPAVIHGYPSSLYLLAQFMIEHDWRDLRPRAIFTASETLLDFQRAAIERAFAAPVFNWYGTTEMTCNIVECAFGSLHYRTDYGVLELREGGEMVATGLNNPAMPLIRYRAGDVASARPGTCDCGCAFPLIERIEGRIEDYIRTPEGRLVGRLDHLFKDARHLREAQIVQTQLDEVTLRVVTDDGFAEQPILNEARQRLGATMKIRFERVPAIERTAGGKFQFVVSKLCARSSD